MLSLRNVIHNDAPFLYGLLEERTKSQSISHKKMPTFTEHLNFLKSMPYKAWWIVFDREPMGMAYLTKNDEIGVFLLKKHWNKGYGKRLIKMITEQRPEKRFLANINPNNKRSIGVFQKLGFKKIQVTFELEKK